MIKNFLKFIFILIFIFPINQSFSHEEVADSQCNLFIKNVINNYESIKDHYWVSYTDPLYGFEIENMDPNLIYKDKDGETFGDTKFRRDENGNIFIGNVFSTYASKTKLKAGDKIVEIMAKIQKFIMMKK